MKHTLAWPSLLVFIVVIFGVDFIEKLLLEKSMLTWYPTLIQPAWTAPPAVFGPVWTALYLLMAVAGWLLYLADPSSNRTQALLWYAIQLVLNPVWSLIVFGFHSLSLGFFTVVVLWLCVIVTMVKAWPVNRLATYLFIPIILWMTYAATINAGMWVLNPT